MGREKVQPHCMVCRKPFKREDKVYIDTMATQIQHVTCFIYKPEYIKDQGSYEEIVNKYPQYKRSFIVADKPITDLFFLSSLRKI